MSLASRLDAEIVSVDSMQVYRGMDIGTAKPTAADRAAVPHHLVDVADPRDPYSVAEFQKAGRAALESIAASGRTAIVCGGSGLHFRALVDPLDFPPTDSDLRASLEVRDHESLIDELLEADPEAGRNVDLANPRRVMRAVEVHRLTGATPSERADSDAARAVKQYRSDIDVFALGVDPEDGLAGRVDRRLQAMFADGFVDEVRRLASWLGPTASLAVGYREVLEVVEGRRSEAEALSAAKRATVALAKRQRTFFRRDPRIRWLPWNDRREQREITALKVLEEDGKWIS